jgi:hypothetical protein
MIKVGSLIEYVQRVHKNSLITEEVFMKLISLFRIVKFN